MDAKWFWCISSERPYQMYKNIDNVKKIQILLLYLRECKVENQSCDQLCVS